MYSNYNTRDRIHKNLNNMKQELDSLKSDPGSLKDPNLIKYDLWLSNCASLASEIVYNKTSGLRILSEKTQPELDPLIKDFNLQMDNKNYDNLVKFIIIDKKNFNFLTNDIPNLDFIRTNISLFLKDGSNLFNYVSSKGKWYNISDNIESNPYFKTKNPKIDIETFDPKNFIEAYWFPNNYKFPKEDETILSELFKDINNYYEETINNETNKISLYENITNEKKVFLIIDVILIVIILILLYYIGLKKIKKSLRVINFINNTIEKRSTLFKTMLFILLSILTFGLLLSLLDAYSHNGIDIYYVIIMMFIVFYCIFILPKFIKFTLYIDEIIKGSDKIINGDINFMIKEKGDKALLKLAQNINSINKGFKISIEEQIKNERLKSELVTNVSHDLKTPLTSIVNYTDILLREDISEEERAKFLQVLNSKSLRLKKLIEDLFEISKINSGKVDLNMSPVDVVELVDQSIAEYSDTEIYLDKNLSFIIQPFNPVIEMNLDGNKMSRVFENLINNALKYSLKETRVYVTLEEIEKGIKISFKNISFDALNFDKNEIFERFTRGDRSRNSEVDGSGLGLSIAKSIVELHGGKMYIEFDGDLFKAIIELYY